MDSKRTGINGSRIDLGPRTWICGWSGTDVSFCQPYARDLEAVATLVELRINNYTRSKLWKWGYRHFTHTHTHTHTLARFHWWRLEAKEFKHLLCSNLVPQTQLILKSFAYTLGSGTLFQMSHCFRDTMFHRQTLHLIIISGSSICDQMTLRFMSTNLSQFIGAVVCQADQYVVANSTASILCTDVACTVWLVCNLACRSSVAVDNRPSHIHQIHHEVQNNKHKR